MKKRLIQRIIDNDVVLSFGLLIGFFAVMFVRGGTQGLVLDSYIVEKTFAEVTIDVKGTVDNGIFIVSEVIQQDSKENPVKEYFFKKADRKVYVYDDGDIDEDQLRRLGITPLASVTAPASVNDEILALPPERFHEYVYDAEIFDVLDSKCELWVAVRAFVSFITQGDGMIILLTSCCGIVMLGLIKYLPKIIVGVCTKMNEKKRQSRIAESYNEQVSQEELVSTCCCSCRRVHAEKRNDLNMEAKRPTIEERIVGMKRLAAGKGKEIPTRKYGHKYVHERYMALLDELNSCTVDEINSIRIMLKKHIGTGQRANEYGNIVTLFVALVSLVISGIVPFMVEMVQQYEADPLELMEPIADMVLLVCMLAIIIFVFIHMFYSHNAEQYGYLLDVVEAYMSEQKESNQRLCGILRGEKTAVDFDCDAVEPIRYVERINDKSDEKLPV